MGTVTLSPDTVTVTAFNVYTGSTFIGGDTSLGDSSDATYGEVWTSRRPGDVGQDHIIATFPAITGLTTLNSVTLSARVRYATTGAATTLRFDMKAETTAADYLGTFLTPVVDEFASTVAATGTTYDLTTWTFDDFGATTGGPLTITGAALAAGTFQMSISSLSTDTDLGSSADWGLTVYELALIVDYATAGVWPLRRYPPVNNGGSGPTRHYPRAVNRRAGGTY